MVLKCFSQGEPIPSVYWQYSADGKGEMEWRGESKFIAMLICMDSCLNTLSSNFHLVSKGKKIDDKGSYNIMRKKNFISQKCIY